MNKDTTVWFSASGRTIRLVSEEINLSGYSQGITPSEGLKVKHPSIDSKNLTHIWP